MTQQSNTLTNSQQPLFQSLFSAGVASEETVLEVRPSISNTDSSYNTNPEYVTVNDGYRLIIGHFIGFVDSDAVIQLSDNSYRRVPRDQVRFRNQYLS